MRISAANLGEFDAAAAAAARDELGGLAASGRVFKGLESDGEGSACADRVRFGRGSPRVLAGLEVGDDLDRWAPPGSGTGARARLVIRCGGGEVCAACWACAARAGSWRWAMLRREKGGERGRQAAGGSWAFGPKPEGESFSFIFLFLFSFKTNLFQNIFKTKFKFLFKL